MVECRQREYGYLPYDSYNLDICLKFFLINYFWENSQTCFTSPRQNKIKTLSEQGLEPKSSKNWFAS